MYLGNYERQTIGGVTRELHYISGGAGLAAIIIRESGVNRFYHVYTDHLGSILTLTDGSGNVVAEQNFDAWGRNRNVSTWDYANVGATPPWLYRGYTGHEHLSQFMLINMNGRMYDPVQGRMMSPDNYVANASSTQAYNRYSYANNNPLSYIDPSGDIAWFVPIIIGAAVGVLTNGMSNDMNGDAFFKGAGKAALIGGISGAASFGIGQLAVGMSGIGQFAFQTTAHGIMGGFMSVANGGTFEQGLLSGAAGSAVGAGVGAAFNGSGVGLEAFGTVFGGAVAGGVGAELAGGDFWDGVRNGAISAGLNHALHFGIREFSGVNQVAKNTEEIADRVYKLKTGERLTGKQISTLNPKLSMAKHAINKIVRTETGFTIDISLMGRLAISSSGMTIKDGSHFQLTEMYNKTDRIFHINSPGNKIYFTRNLVDLNVYVNNNVYSVYRNFSKYQAVWK